MPEAFTEAFVAVRFFHGSYRGSFHGIFVLKLLWKKAITRYVLLQICCLLPRKLGLKISWKQLYFHEIFRERFRESFRGNFGGSNFHGRSHGSFHGMEAWEFPWTLSMLPW